MEHLKIGSSVWTMSQNKPTQWWVWEVNTREFVNTGAGYENKIDTIISYRLGTGTIDSRYNYSEWGATHTELETMAFKTKEELIASL